VHISLLFILLGLFIPAIGGATCTPPCRTDLQTPDRPNRIDGSYRAPDGTRAVIPKFKGAMKGAKPKLYQLRHRKHPAYAAPLPSSVHP
jgi:hypothetical protein